ncbi:ABC transporter substrate-binding protein [Rheinheimera sp.]|uniref:substrate-binding periplasmic protein n=1 Tax=Rheinheimera sp. TaxID=1869214 RepID=UPI0027350A77|nr:transporter substrate-binding domain-containing protein [Rheinheimera sp.]MDP2716056.1 transporter substrate-binding domain-containing protein [Rheinheimera sp.]
MRDLMRELCLILLCLAALPVAGNTAPIRAVVSDSNTPPYAIFNADKVLQAGLSKDIIDELGRQLNRPVLYLNLPRARVEPWLLQGEAEIACFLNPDWVSQPEQLLWTDALFNTQQLLVRLRQAEPVAAVQHLAGKRVGTSRGFTYPELEQVFRSGDVIRDDAHSLESNLLRLKQGRLDVVMTVDLSYHFYVNTTGDHSFAADPLWSAPPAVYCGLSRHDATGAQQLNATLSRMVQSGFIQRRLTFYTGRIVAE